MRQNLTAGNNFSLSIDAESKEEADKIFDRLSKDAKTTMPLADAFWGAYFGMLTDKFGVQWMINYDYNRQHKAS
jgi:PhnB protein